MDCCSVAVYLRNSAKAVDRVPHTLQPCWAFITALGAYWRLRYWDREHVLMCHNGGINADRRLAAVRKNAAAIWHPSLRLLTLPYFKP